MNNEPNIRTTDVTELYAIVRDVLQKARQNIARSVNSVIVQAYWQVGRCCNAVRESVSYLR